MMFDKIKVNLLHKNSGLNVKDSNLTERLIKKKIKRITFNKKVFMLRPNSKEKLMYK